MVPEVRPVTVILSVPPSVVASTHCTSVRPVQEPEYIPSITSVEAPETQVSVTPVPEVPEGVTVYQTSAALLAVKPEQVDGAIDCVARQSVPLV